MILSRQQGRPLDQVRQVMTLSELTALQRQAQAIYVSPEVADYLVALVNGTRTSPLLQRGGSPRATLAVMSMAKALACASGRDYVIPDQIQAVFCEVMDHRVELSDEGQAKGLSVMSVLREIVKSTPAPIYRTR